MKTLLRYTLFATLFLIVNHNLEATNSIYTSRDSVIFNSYKEYIAGCQHGDIGDIIIKTGTFFLDVPYVGGTLEAGDNEQLVVNLRELDCTTFVENCIALSRLVKYDQLSFDNYLRALTKSRYRNGIIDGYASRLHYTTEWKFANEKAGILSDITLRMQGKNIAKPINFMSTHHKLYKHLKDERTVRQIAETEKDITNSRQYTFIPRLLIPKVQSDIKNGDIILFATSKPGLDYSHMGIAYIRGDSISFIHASSTEKKVVIEKKSLSAYCNSSKTCTGIAILRVN